MKADKRFIRSESMIRKAFLSLMESKPYSKIKVTEICQLADCSRNAFYLHYETKEHLLSSIIIEITNHVQRSCQPIVNSLHQVGRKESKQYTDQILQAIEENKHVVTILLKQQQMNFLNCLSNTLIKTMTECSERLKVTPNIPFIVYFSNGICGFINYWLTTDLTLEEAQEILHQTIFYQYENEIHD